MEQAQLTSDDFRQFLKTVLPLMGYRWRRFERRNIKRRVRARMDHLGIHEFDRYARCVKEDDGEKMYLDSLLRLTITRFFRNFWLWQDLGTLITDMQDFMNERAALKIWSAGCAGGEESFSAAMLLRDLGRSGNFRNPWRIVATDTNPAALKRSRKAEYKWGSVREVPTHMLAGWFTEKDGLWTLDQGIRDSVEFKVHDLVFEKPPGSFHIVFLRNSVLTYNTEDIQSMVLERIHECLLDPGCLVIGRTEKMPEGAGFEEVSRCIYRKSRKRGMGL